jgi:hypothetical protein
MLKRLIAICLLVALISSHFSRFSAYAGFELNRKYIAEKLCENRSRPWLHCNGKCYFMKKIKQAAENERKQEAKDNLNRLEVSLFQEPFRLQLVEPTLLQTTKQRIPLYSYQYSNHYLSSVFRPPKQIA